SFGDASPSRAKQGMVIWAIILRKFVFTPNSAKSEGETYQRNDSGLHGAVEGLVGRGGQVPEFDEAGGRRGLGGAGDPGAVHARGALQAVAEAGVSRETEEEAAIAVGFNGEMNVCVEDGAVVDE